LIVPVPAILDPLPDIAGDLMEPPGIGRQTADRDCPFPENPGLGPAVIVIVAVALVVGLVGVDAVAGPERGPGAGPGGVLPLGLGGQPVGLAGLDAQPGRIFRGVVPGDVDYRPLVPPPALIPRLRAPGGRGEVVVLGEGDLSAADGKGA